MQLQHLLTLFSLSQPRHDKTLGALQLDEELARHNADALQIIDLTSGDVVHWLKIEGDVSEIYDVIALSSHGHFYSGRCSQKLPVSP